MSGDPRETFEHEGPKCPCCGRQYTADEAFFYDESAYTEEVCDQCGETFDVRVYTSTTWTCTERVKEPPPRMTTSTTKAAVSADEVELENGDFEPVILAAGNLVYLSQAGDIIVLELGTAARLAAALSPRQDTDEMTAVEMRREMLEDRMGLALYDLSDRLRRIGALNSDNVHTAYEAVVKAWSDLVPTTKNPEPDHG